MIIKPFNIILICATLLGCSTSKKIGHVAKTWDEVGHTPFSDYKSGIPVYDGAIVAYKRAGKAVLKVKLGEPVVVGVATKVEKWGFFNFPMIYRSLDNDNVVVAKWYMCDDAVESYGKFAFSFSTSKDGGKSWSPVQKEPVNIGSRMVWTNVELPDGDRIEIYTPQALKVEDIQLPKPVESSSNGSTYYKLNELPENLQGVYINRLHKGETKWTTEHAALDDPKAVRRSYRGLFPVVWWGDMHIATDGSIIAGIYPGFILGEDGKVDPTVSFYRSTDEGRTWKIQGRIPYIPDLKADPNGEKRLDGFTEPGFEILSDGSFLCVMRTNGPMYFSRSTDLGLTWSKPEPFTRNGVLPRLLQLDNGVIVLASGRPGMQLRFCTDGKGEKWTDPFQMLPFENEKESVSCGYPGLLATGPDSFLLIYSDFKYQNQAGEIRKAIKVREVIVTPK